MKVALGSLDLSAEEAVRIGKVARGPDSRSNAPATREQARAWALARLDAALGRSAAEPAPAVSAPVVTRPSAPSTPYDPSGAAALQRAVRAALQVCIDRRDLGVALPDVASTMLDALRPVAGWCGLSPDDLP